MSKKVNFTANQIQLIEWLACPKYGRSPPTQEMLSKEIGVRSETLTRWKRVDGLLDAVNQRARELLGESLPDIYGSLVHEAVSGSFQHQRLALEITGEYTPRQDLAHSGEVVIPVTLVEVIRPEAQSGMTVEAGVYTIKNGTASIAFHPGQLRAWDSTARIVAVLAGTQSGKTVLGPLWLWREMIQKGPGDYLAVTPSYPLLQLKALPEFLRWFKDTLHLGEYKQQTKQFVIDKAGEIALWGSPQETPSRVIFGYAAEPESLESATAKAAWLDEAGQKRFKVDSWEAIRRRLSIFRGRVLITTTPYNLGWLKQRIWDVWKRGEGDIDVIRFESIENPIFSLDEWEEAKRDMPRWRFQMFYRAIFTRPAGQIYDVFNEDTHKCPRFPIPWEWPRFVGVDFGGVNTAALYYAEDPKDKRLYLYREYKAGGRTAKEHGQHILTDEPGIPYCAGGSKSEGQWRREFHKGGLPIKPPIISDVEVGIDRVYAAHRNDGIVVFDDLHGYLDEKMSYSRELDSNGDPTEKIEDKNTFHFMDAERYIIGRIRPGASSTQVRSY